jgi:hypothetical protein
MKPAVEDLDNTVLWDSVAQVITGILKEDKLSDVEEEGRDEELEGFTTSAKVLKHHAIIILSTPRTKLKHIKCTKIT